MNSYTQHIKNQMQTTKQRVMSLLQWDEKQYGDYQYRMGTQYLQSYISTDPIGIDMLVDSRIFWNWWKNHWQTRDEQFLETADHDGLQIVLRILYSGFHNPQRLVNEIYPNAVVLTDAYCYMIADINKSIHQVKPQI